MLVCTQLKKVNLVYLRVYVGQFFILFSEYILLVYQAQSSVPGSADPFRI